MLDMLKELCCLNGVSGYETEVFSYLDRKAVPLADMRRSDPAL